MTIADDGARDVARTVLDFLKPDMIVLGDGSVAPPDAGHLAESHPRNETSPMSTAERKRCQRRRDRTREALLCSRPDWRLFIDARTLPQKARCLPGDIRPAVINDIVDNGLDNGGGAIEAWNYLEAFKYRGCVICDNCQGIDSKQVAQLFGVNRILFSSKLRCAPLRGVEAADDAADSDESGKAE